MRRRPKPNTAKQQLACTWPSPPASSPRDRAVTASDVVQHGSTWPPRQQKACPSVVAAPSGRPLHASSPRRSWSRNPSASSGGDDGSRGASAGLDSARGHLRGNSRDGLPPVAGPSETLGQRHGAWIRHQQDGPHIYEKKHRSVSRKGDRSHREHDDKGTAQLPLVTSDSPRQHLCGGYTVGNSLVSPQSAGRPPRPARQGSAPCRTGKPPQAPTLKQSDDLEKFASEEQQQTICVDPFPQPADPFCITDDANATWNAQLAMHISGKELSANGQPFTEEVESPRGRSIRRGSIERSRSASFCSDNDDPYDALGDMNCAISSTRASDTLRRDSNHSVQSVSSASGAVVEGDPLWKRLADFLGDENGQANIQEEDHDPSQPDDNALNAWDEWRARFPLETLDMLCDYFDDIPRGVGGVRTIAWGDLAEVEKMLALPADAISQELIARRRLKAPLPQLEDLSFASLQHFLELLHSAALRTELERSELLWTQRELMSMREAFDICADGSGCVPTPRIFDFVRELRFLHITECDAEHQKVIADAARIVFERKGLRQSMWNKNKKSIAACKQPFEEMLQIVTLAEQMWKRRVRTQDIANEERAQREAAFTALEVEDLRELHRTWLDLPSCKDHVERLAALFSQCGVPKLSDADVLCLRNIVTELPASKRRNGIVFTASLKAASADEIEDLVPFSLFLQWMNRVFQRRIGGLARSIASQEAQYDHGFITAMTRERGRERELSVTSPVKPTHQPKHASASPLSSRKASNAHSGTATSLGGKETPRIKGRGSICQSSGHSSKYSSARQSVDGIEKDGLDGERTGNVFTMKGLPPSESMLRREMRVCSVDMGKEQVIGMDGIAVPQSPSSHGKMGLLGEMNEILQKQGQALCHGRKVKGAQDSEMLVLDAISKLRGDDASDEDVCEAPPSKPLTPTAWPVV